MKCWCTMQWFLVLYLRRILKWCIKKSYWSFIQDWVIVSAHSVTLMSLCFIETLQVITVLNYWTQFIKCPLDSVIPVCFKVACIDPALRLLVKTVPSLLKVQSYQPTNFFLSFYSLSCNHLSTLFFILNLISLKLQFTMWDLYLKCFVLAYSSNFEVSYRLSEIYAGLILSQLYCFLFNFWSTYIPDHSLSLF